MARRPRLLDVALVIGAAVAAGVLVLLDGQGFPEWLFGTFMLSCLFLVLRFGVDAWRSARLERGRATRLAAMLPSEVAQQAVDDERRRLAADIETCLRDTLTEVAREVEELDDDDPVPGLRRVHAQARQATSELRRQLGLLREPAPVPAGIHASDPDGVRALSRGDLVAGAAMAVLAFVEAVGYLVTEGPADWSWWSVAFTALAGSTIAGCRGMPAGAALVCAAVFSAGTILGTPVMGGFWSVGTLGVLVWSAAAVASQHRTALHLASAATLAVVVPATRWVSDRSNVGVTVVVIGVAAAGGLVVGLQRRRDRAARDQATSREHELGLAAEEALRQERGAFARELHDVVSHAVGVIAMQAAAAEMSWPANPDVVRRAVGVIRATTAETLADLDRLMPEAPSLAGHGVADLHALVDRIRDAGTAVDLTLLGPPPGCADVVYRIVQESLTNTVRHAPGARVQVSVSTGDSGTEVQVSDDGPGPEAGSPRGYGLVGVAERVAFAHGRLETGIGPDGRGFVVAAFLPTQGRVRAS